MFINDGKGNFTRKDLPEELQLSPIFSFATFPGLNSEWYIANGNFYKVLPYEGRYDAMNPTIFNYEKKSGQISILSELPFLNGEFRDAKLINCSAGKVLVLARNNDQLIFLKPNK